MPRFCQRPWPAGTIPDLYIRLRGIIQLMDLYSPPTNARLALFRDARQRDTVTARRALLLEFIWRERYLTREGLLWRLAALLGRDCFGGSAWEDTFYRDMRAVKKAFKSAGYELRYSRRPERPGYYLAGQPALAPELAAMIRSCSAEIDPAQIRIFRRLTVAERFRLGFSVSEAARAAAGRSRK